MYPNYDTEGQIAAYNYMLKRLEDGRDSPSSFISTLIASVVAAAATPTALWLFFTLSKTGVMS